MDMTGPVGPNALDRQHGLVGQPIDRVEGPLKVTGTAPYAYEVQEAGPPLYGYLVQTAVAKGRIRAIDADAAQRSPGVLLVLTHENAPEQGDGSSENVSRQLAPEIAHYGQSAALVVADTFERARAAAYLLRIACDEQHGAYDLKAEAGEARTPKARMAPPDSAVGDFAAAFEAAPHKVDLTYTTPVQTHAMMEPHATLAVWADNKLTLHTSNQNLDNTRKVVANTLKLPPDQVRVVGRYIGGGFGSKLHVYADAILAGMAARQLNRPVKVALTRQQIFHETSHRSDTVQRLRLAADRDGRLVAVGQDALSGNLPSEDFYESAANQTRTLYAGANRLTRHRLAKLDLPLASSMRAPGEAVGMLALECAMDELAEQCGLDPIELRVRNEPTEDPEKHIPFSSRQLIPCMREGAQRFGWNKRDPKPGQVRDGRWLVGMGMAAASRQSPLRPAKASVHLGPDGVLTARSSMTDIGTGSYTVFTQVAGELLGLPPDKVRMELGDSDFPDSPGSGGSFGAVSVGSALFVACTALRDKLAQAAGVDPAAAEFTDGNLVAAGQSRPIGSLAGASGIDADGAIGPGDVQKRFSSQSYGAHFVEIGVDADTGEVRLRRMLGVFSVGRVLNAKTARSQAIGGMIFGLGGALEEDVAIDGRFGCFVNHDLAEYHVPVHADVPGVDAVLLPELDNELDPLKSKGIGELGICGSGAAVNNAIYNACGVRVRDYPVTLDKILAGMPLRA